MPDRFSAFSFVDRITALESGRRARGRFAIPAALPAFSTGLVAEAVGQLAAWAAMAHAGFRRRPVAALAGEMRIVGEAAPGEIVDLGVEIETLRSRRRRLRRVGACRLTRPSWNCSGAWDRCCPSRSSMRPEAARGAISRRANLRTGRTARRASRVVTDRRSLAGSTDFPGSS